MSAWALEVQGLCKEYKDFSLKDISFQVPMGSITGLIGRNGAGKSTILNCIAGTAGMNAGTVLFQGQPMTQEAKQNIGFMLDKSWIPDGYSIQDINKVAKNFYHHWDEEYFFGLCEEQKLPRKKALRKLSEGMRKQALIFSAMAHSPKLLILDEPTNGLDLIARRKMFDIFGEYVNDGEHSILISTHITSDLETIAEVLFLTQGRIQPVIQDDYFLVKGASAQIACLDDMDVVGKQRRGKTFDALCRGNLGEAKQRYSNEKLKFEPPTIENIFVMMEGGENDEKDERIVSL